MSHRKKNYFSFLHLCLAVESLDVSNFPPGRVPSERFWVDSVREGMTEKHTYTLHNETENGVKRPTRSAEKDTTKLYFVFSNSRRP